MEPPPRDYTRPFRLPISNIFKAQSMSGVYIAGRIAGGIVQVGEKVRVMPGDDSVSGIVQCACITSPCLVKLMLLGQRLKWKKLV